jgi:hypothetical protein
LERRLRIRKKMGERRERKEDVSGEWKKSMDGKKRGMEKEGNRNKGKEEGMKKLWKKGEEKVVTSSQIFIAEIVLWSSGLRRRLEPVSDLKQLQWNT